MTRMLEKILLVDDDEVTNLLHQRRISRCGFAKSIDTATDGQAALDYLRLCAEKNEKPPDLVLLDINMPRMNGFEFLNAFEALPPEVTKQQHIVMVSTSNLKQDKARAELDRNVRGYETKPLMDDDLERIVLRCRSVDDRL